MKSPGQTVPKKSREDAKKLSLKGGTPDDVPPAMSIRPPPILPKNSTGFSSPPQGERKFGENTNGKNLLVGRDISLSGTISSCEKLIVEGIVETNISECRELEITNGGLFKGEAKIEMAEIAGEFVGSLSADLLILRKSGRVSGNLTYGQLEVERGGEITGNISKIEGNTES
jgi:cytoskeletal protein CcmA (bactofilin family)